MGGILVKLFDRFRSDARLLMLGLDAAGKTTILYKMKLNEVVTSVPTIGFNLEEIRYKNLTMNIWDVGGQTKIRRLWRHYYQNTDGLIYVVDSADPDRIDEAREELHAITSDDLMRRVPVLVLANKCDQPRAMAPAAVVKALQLESLRTRWFVQQTNALTGDGLYDGFDWLANELKHK